MHQTIGEVLGNMPGWRLREIELGIKANDRQGHLLESEKGGLNGTDLRRMLVNMGISWTNIKGEVPSNELSRDFTKKEIVHIVGRCQKAGRVRENGFRLLQKADKKANRTETGRILPDVFYDELLQHGLTAEDINLVLYQYADWDEEYTEADEDGEVKRAWLKTKRFNVKWGEKKGANEDISTTTQNYKAPSYTQDGRKKVKYQYNYSSRINKLKEEEQQEIIKNRQIVNAKIRYEDLLRDMFPDLGNSAATLKCWEKE